MARRFPRYEVRYGAELDVAGRTITGITRNLSTGGVCIEVPQELSEGASFPVRLFLVEDDVEAEGHGSLQLDATVQWVAEAEQGGFAAGFRFNSLSATQMEALLAAIQSLGG